jgi:hypothetical protein
MSDVPGKPRRRDDDAVQDGVRKILAGLTDLSGDVGREPPTVAARRVPS